MVRRVLAGLLIVCLLVWPWHDVVEATVSSGASSTRNVFTLTASGAAKVAAAELKIANAIRILGMLGRFAGWVGVGFALVDIALNTWDWWHQEYNAGTAGTPIPSGTGNWGVYGSGGYISGKTVCADGTTIAGDPIYSWMRIVGQQSYQSSTAFGGVHGVCSWTYLHFVDISTLPTESGAAVPLGGETNRQAFADQVSGALADIDAADNATVGGNVLVPGMTYESISAALNDALAVVSGGVALESGDYTQGSGWVNGDGSASGNEVPGAVSGGGQGSGETTTSPPSTESGDMSAVTAAVNAVTAAVQASQAAVVSAVNAATSAISASQAAVVSAVNAATSAISASQAAVVSAVQAVAAPIVAAISDAKTAIVAAIQAQPSGGAGGATEAIESLAADEAARDQAAEDQVASTPAPSVSCPVCNRADKWSDAWSTLRDAALGAPVFGLINRIAINPMGTITRVQTVNTAHYGALTFDLTAWGIDTYIGVVRYVVIFAAMIAGYFVIFG